MGRWATTPPPPAGSLPTCASARIPPIWRGAPGGPAETEEGQPPAYAARLFVAASNTNNVYSVGVGASKDLKILESINVSTTPRHPLGMTPSALALSADRKTPFRGLLGRQRGRRGGRLRRPQPVDGFIPTGWYPTAVRALPSGGLVVLNGKGLRSYPNPDGPNPAQAAPSRTPACRAEYVARMQTGTASWIDPFTDEQLDAWTRTALANSPYQRCQAGRSPTRCPPSST